MGLDPWTIIGLTGNIVQFIDFTSKIVSASIEIYQSASGATLSNQDAEFVADDLAALTMRLESSLRPRGVHLALNENEQRLEDLRCRCENVAWALLVKLEKLRGKGKGDGKVKSLGKAIRNVWSKSDVEAIEKSLGDLRRELELRVLVEMKYSTLVIWVVWRCADDDQEHG
jgi:hypothetical protein